MSRLKFYWFLQKVIGRRIALGYGAVSLLSVAILVSLYLASRYGLEAYVSDQLGRIPWEISVLQRGETQRFPELQAEYRKLPDVRAVEGLGFLRLRNISPIRLEVENGTVPVRWVAFVSASTEKLLPPELRDDVRKGNAERPVGEAPNRVQAALVGAPGHADAGNLGEIHAGNTVRLILSLGPERESSEHSHEVNAKPGSNLILFEGQLANNPPQIERQEFNRYMLREVGALAYLPEESIVIPVSQQQFQELAAKFHDLFMTSERMHGGDDPPPYVPEMTHLISLDRESLVSTWDLSGSLVQLEPAVQTIYQKAQDLTPFAWVNSDLVRLLMRMNSISRLISLATLLVGIPLLWMGWVLARWLGRLLVLNHRRLIGLALLRGISSREAGRSVLFALVLGGAGGGVGGLLLGTGIPVLAYSLAGRSLPPSEVLLDALVYYGAFLIVGVALAMLSGRDVLQFVRRLTPREAISRADEESTEAAALTLSPYYVASFLIALLLGSYKIASWIAGRSILVAALRDRGYRRMAETTTGLEGLLNFAAVPLLLYGLAGLLLWRVGVVQRGISALTAPTLGNLDWFVSQYMALRRHRVAQLLFVASMATSLSLMPQIAGDGFYDRIIRGVRTSLGAKVLLEFEFQSLGINSVGPAPLARYEELLEPRLEQLRERISAETGVTAVEVIQQFLIPGVYIPGQSGLILNVINDPGEYLKMVSYEDGLGLTRRFPDAVKSLQEGNVLGSQGLFRLRAIPLKKPVVLGYGGGGDEIHLQFGDVVAFLPGQPALGIAQREGFAEAEVDYLNYLLGADARMILSRKHLNEQASLGGLTVIPSRAVFLISTQEDRPSQDLIARLNSNLPWQPEQVRWEDDERRRLGKDMFVSLALENMRVYMIGSLLLACASVLAIALSNFVADKRTFGLLRLRGLAPSVLLRIALVFFLLPVLAGVVVGVGVGAISGFGLSQAIWDLPRVVGVGGFLRNRLTVSLSAAGIILVLSAIFAAVAWGLGVWLFRRTAREAIRE